MEIIISEVQPNIPSTAASKRCVSSPTTEGFECAQIGCAICVNMDLPSSTQVLASKLKRSQLVEGREVLDNDFLSPSAKDRLIVPHARYLIGDLAKRTQLDSIDPSWKGNQDHIGWSLDTIEVVGILTEVKKRFILAKYYYGKRPYPPWRRIDRIKRIDNRRKVERNPTKEAETRRTEL